MDEAAAKAWLAVPRGTMEKLETLVDLLTEENARQNLVSRASLEEVWSRHIVDSAQLVALALPDTENWLDLGTGAGFPGLVVALLHRSRVVMVESRRLRADFLRRCAAALCLKEKVEIVCARVESLPPGPFDAISARAFAPLDRLFALGIPFSKPGTRWLLPKGRNAKSELEAARSSWQGDFRLEPSVTDPDAGIIVADRVRRKAKGK